MAGFTPLPLRAALIAGLLATVAAGVATAQEKVGINSAVNPEASGAPPGGAVRKLVIGQDVVFNEHITTGDVGQTQLVFLDESSMTVGPNSDLTIDQFVYDPKSGGGKLAMSATKGLLRYVGGKLSKQDEGVTLRTSTATLAVRGGAFIVNISPNGNTDAVFIYGKGLTMTGQNGGSQTITRPGYHSSTGPGGGPTTPAPQPPGQLDAMLAQLDGRVGGSGGASIVPTDASVVNSGVGQTISGNFQQSLQQAQNNQGGGSFTPNYNPTNPGSVGPNSDSSQTQNVGNGSQLINQLVQCGSSCNNSSSNGSQGVMVINQNSGNNNNNTGNNTPPPPPPPAPPVPYTGRAKYTNGNGTTRGFVDQSANGDVAYSNGSLNTSTNVFTANAGNLGTISFVLPSGSSQISGTSSTLGAFTGTSFQSADGTFFYANVTPASQPSQRLFLYGGMSANSSFYPQTGSTRLFAFSVQPDGALQSNIPFIRSQTGGNLPNATVSPFYVVAPPSTPIGAASTVSAARGMQASLAINGTGANQQSAIAVTSGQFGTLNSSGQPIFNGVLRGSSLQSATGTPTAITSAVSSTVDGAGNSLYGNGSISGFVLDQTAYNGSQTGSVGTAITPSTATETPLSGTATTYGFAQPAIPQALPSGVGTNRSTQATNGFFGGLMYTTAQTSSPYVVTGGTLISTDAPNNRIQATLSGSAQTPSAGATNISMQYGSLTGAAGGQAFVDNNTYAAAESQVNPQQITINGTTSQPTGQLYFASSGAAGAPTSILPSGVSYCQCQYLQWGYWGGSLSTPSATGGTPRIDSAHINTWVSGSPTSTADLNSLIGQSAIGSYSGAAIGSVFNNGSSYVAAGGFNGTYNFGSQTGTFTISNFDGHTVSASGSAPLTGSNYNFAVNSAGAKGAINGSFYGPAAAETGGNFAFQSTVGPTYLASGVYAGKR